MSNVADADFKIPVDQYYNNVIPCSGDGEKIGWFYFHQLFFWSVILLIPVVVSFILPFIMLAIVYGTSLYFKAHRYFIKRSGKPFTLKSRQDIATPAARFYAAQARFWYGYEIEGFENIPLEGPALIVFYHGALPIDWYYLLANVINHKKRMIGFVGDRFLFTVPGFDGLIDCLGICTGSVESCADSLRKGNLFAIAPGGVREAFFGDENYPVMWGKRYGFAKVAIEAKVPIIPMFTKNVREAFFTLKFGRERLRKVYERTRQPVVPIFGGLPVKLTTIIGKPIPYDPTCTAEELAEKVELSIKDLIRRYQETPGSVIRAVKERILHLMKKNKCV